MASQHEVTCVNKDERLNPYERITHIGGPAGNGQSWRITQQEAIKGIESGQWQFYVRRGGQVVWVVVAISRYGNKYLKTQADGELPNNLLSLPECR